jgi:chromosome segregation ATPase
MIEDLFIDPKSTIWRSFVIACVFAMCLTLCALINFEKTIEDSIEKANSDIEHYQASMAELQSKVDMLEATIEKKSHIISDLNDTVKRKNVVIADLHDTVKGKNELIADLNDIIRDKNKRIAAQKFYIAHQTSIISSHTSSVEDLNATLTRRNNDLSARNTMLLSRDALIASLQNTLDSKCAALELKHDELMAMDMQNANLQQNIHAWHANTAGTVHAMQSVIDELRGANAELRTGNADLSSKVGLQAEALTRRHVAEGQPPSRALQDFIAQCNQLQHGGRVQQDNATQTQDDGEDASHIQDDGEDASQSQDDGEDATSAGAAWDSESLGGSTLVGSDDEDEDEDEDEDDDDIWSEDGWGQIMHDAPAAGDELDDIDVSYFQRIDGVEIGEVVVVGQDLWQW